MLYKSFFKRFIDFLASFFGLLILSPLLLMVMVLLSFANKGKPFFFQIRPGKNEKLFKIIKFKTMNDAKDEQGNSSFGEIYSENTMDSYIFSPRKFTAVVGLENVIVIDTNDALLICNRENAQDVKHVVDYLKMNDKDKLL